MPRPRPAAPAARRRGWHALALFWGVLVLLGHVMTWHDVFPEPLLYWEPTDLVKHFTGMGLFTLLYRASWTDRAAGRRALLVCCGWGALCELLQLFVPLRDFNWFELGLNTMVPALLIGLWWLVAQVWDG